MSTVDLNDTSRCPVGDQCEGCGDTEDLSVQLASTLVGVFCLTLDSACADAGKLPRPAGWAGAMDRVAAHCQHLGINVDQMGEAMEREAEAER